MDPVAPRDRTRPDLLRAAGPWRRRLLGVRSSRRKGGGAIRSLGEPSATWRLLTVDVSEVVQTGRPLAGAHSDIVHPELARVAGSAAGLVGTAAPPRCQGVSEHD